MGLRRAHPNFWLVFVAMALYHLWSGAAQVWGDDRFFTAPSQGYVYEYIDRPVWGVAQLIVAGLLLFGLRLSTFDVARLGLGLGLLVCIARLWFQVQAFVDGAGGAIGIPTFALIAVFHAAATLEPPVNPASANR